MELITAVGLFAIFSLVVLVGINPLAQYKKAQDARRKNDLAQLSRGIELYYGDHGQYPQATNSFYIANDTTGQPIPWGDEWQPYIDLLPEDPSGSKKYVYRVSGDRQSYWLFASLDVKTDPARCKQDTLNGCDEAPIVCSADGSSNDGNLYSCDYGVSSPDESPESQD